MPTYAYVCTICVRRRWENLLPLPFLPLGIKGAGDTCAFTPRSPFSASPSFSSFDDACLPLPPGLSLAFPSLLKARARCGEQNFCFTYLVVCTYSLCALSMSIVNTNTLKVFLFVLLHANCLIGFVTVVLCLPIGNFSSCDVERIGNPQDLEIYCTRYSTVLRICTVLHLMFAEES